MGRSISSSDDRESPIVYYDIELDDAGLNPYEFRIYGRIARRAGGGGHSCTESLTNMAAGCQMSRSSLIRAIKGLLQRKMIYRIRKDGDTSEYRLLDKKHWIPVSHRNGGSVSQERGVVSHRNGGSVCETPKEYKEENKIKKEREKAAPPESKSIASILMTAYRNIASTFRDEGDLRNQIIALDTESVEISDVEEWITTRTSLSSINFIARDFKTWCENRRRKSAAQITSSAVKVTTAPADYAAFYSEK